MNLPLFELELRQLLNFHSVDAICNISDVKLAECIMNFLDVVTNVKDTLDGDEPDDSMDGDHGTALASAGFGTDEDYSG